MPLVLRLASKEFLRHRSGKAALAPLHAACSCYTEGTRARSAKRLRHPEHSSKIGPRSSVANDRLNHSDPLQNNPGLEWASHNRSKAIGMIAAAVVLLIVVVGGYAIYSHRTDAARTAFGEAMQTYQTPLANPAQPVPPGMTTFPDPKARAKAANAEFLAVADKYSMTKPGKLALYFAGLTYMEAGENASAETTLKDVAGSWNSDLSALAKVSLAQLYQQTGRDADAISLYNELAKDHASTVTPGMAQIQLAELYESEGKTSEANKIYAQVKDSDKDAKGNPGAAGEIATQKLGGKK